MERYGSLLLGGLVLVGGALIVLVAFNNGTQAAFACEAQLTPGPTEPNPTQRPSASPSPTASPTPSIAPSSTATGSQVPSASPSASPTAAPSPSPSGSPSASPSITPAPTPVPQPTARLGFTTTDQGRTHVPRGQAVKYAFCPPTSGDHYNDSGAPLKAAVYPATQEQPPGNFIHNFEHGYVVALYRCPSGVIGQGDCISQEEFNKLTEWFNEAPQPPKSQCSSKVLVVRFDLMATKFAILAWDRALLVDQFDVPSALTFAQQWMENDAVPESQAC